MSRVKGKNTGPEIKLRKALWATGLRYRLEYKLFGKPDLVFVSAKIAVFIDGCFWHGCPVHGEYPQTNKTFWAEKIRKNTQRDQLVNTKLAELGWTVVRYWEHEIKHDIVSCVEQITTVKKKGNINGTQVKTT